MFEWEKQAGGEWHKKEKEKCLGTMVNHSVRTCLDIDKEGAASCATNARGVAANASSNMFWNGLLRERGKP